MNKHQKIGGAFMVFGVLALVSFAFLTIALPKMVNPTTELKLGNGVFKAKMATNDADREKGLAGVTSMPSDEALIMVYSYEFRWKIWMKDMKIPIDIIWLNKDKKVIYIVKNAVPKDSTLRTFEPKELAKYVIEMSSGAVGDNSIDIGQTAEFNADGVNVR